MARSSEDLNNVLKKIELIESNIALMRQSTETEQRLRERNLANRHFWISILVPASIALLAMGSNVIVNVMIKK